MNITCKDGGSPNLHRMRHADTAEVWSEGGLEAAAFNHTCHQRKHHSEAANAVLSLRSGRCTVSFWAVLASFVTALKFLPQASMGIDV